MDTQLGAASRWTPTIHRCTDRSSLPTRCCFSVNRVRAKPRRLCLCSNTKDAEHPCQQGHGFTTIPGKSACLIHSRSRYKLTASVAWSLCLELTVPAPARRVGSLEYTAGVGLRDQGPDQSRFGRGTEGFLAAQSQSRQRHPPQPSWRPTGRLRSTRIVLIRSKPIPPREDRGLQPLKDRCNAPYPGTDRASGLRAVGAPGPVPRSRPRGLGRGRDGHGLRAQLQGDRRILARGAESAGAR